MYLISTRHTPITNVGTTTPGGGGGNPPVELVSLDKLAYYTVHYINNVSFYKTYTENVEHVRWDANDNRPYIQTQYVQTIQELQALTPLVGDRVLLIEGRDFVDTIGSEGELFEFSSTAGIDNVPVTSGGFFNKVKDVAFYLDPGNDNFQPYRISIRLGKPFTISALFFWMVRRKRTTTAYWEMADVEIWGGTSPTDVVKICDVPVIDQTHGLWITTTGIYDDNNQLLYANTLTGGDYSYLEIRSTANSRFTGRNFAPKFVGISAEPVDGQPYSIDDFWGHPEIATVQRSDWNYYFGTNVVRNDPFEQSNYHNNLAYAAGFIKRGFSYDLMNHSGEAFNIARQNNRLVMDPNAMAIIQSPAYEYPNDKWYMSPFFNGYDAITEWTFFKNSGDKFYPVFFKIDRRSGEGTAGTTVISEQYDNTKAYVVGNKVYDAGTWYNCIQNNTGQSLGNASFWELADDWDVSKEYNICERVHRLGVRYISKKYVTTGEDPQSSPTAWNVWVPPTDWTYERCNWQRVRTDTSAQDGTSPFHFVRVASFYFQFGAAFGSKTISPSLLKQAHNVGSGLNLIFGVQLGNEDEKYWQDPSEQVYHSPMINAAYASAVADGHMNQLGNGNDVGLWNSDPDMDIIVSCPPNIGFDYHYEFEEWLKFFRAGANGTTHYRNILREGNPNGTGRIILTYNAYPFLGGDQQSGSRAGQFESTYLWQAHRDQARFVQNYWYNTPKKIECWNTESSYDKVHEYERVNNWTSGTLFRTNMFTIASDNKIYKFITPNIGAPGITAPQPPSAEWEYVQDWDGTDRGRYITTIGTISGVATPWVRGLEPHIGPYNASGRDRFYSPYSAGKLGSRIIANVYAADIDAFSYFMFQDGIGYGGNSFTSQFASHGTVRSNQVPEHLFYWNYAARYNFGGGDGNPNHKYVKVSESTGEGLNINQVKFSRLDGLRRGYMLWRPTNVAAPATNFTLTGITGTNAWQIVPYGFNQNMTEDQSLWVDTNDNPVSIGADGFTWPANAKILEPSNLLKQGTKVPLTITNGTVTVPVGEWPVLIIEGVADTPSVGDEQLTIVDDTTTLSYVFRQYDFNSGANTKVNLVQFHGLSVPNLDAAQYGIPNGTGSGVIGNLTGNRQSVLQFCIDNDIHLKVVVPFVPEGMQNFGAAKTLPFADYLRTFAGTTICAGISQGGITTAKSVNVYPGEFDKYMIICGRIEFFDALKDYAGSQIGVWHGNADNTVGWATVEPRLPAWDTNYNEYFQVIYDGAGHSIWNNVTGNSDRFFKFLTDNASTISNYLGSIPDNDLTP